MSKAQKKLLVGVALCLPLSYIWLGDLYYFLLTISGIWNNDAFYEYVLNHQNVLDAIFCLLLLGIVVPIYRWFKKNLALREDPLLKQLTWRNVGLAAVLAFGLGGVATIVQMIIRPIFEKVPALAESVQAFDEAFAPDTSYAAYFWTFLSIVLVGPIIEELIFRGVLYNGLTLVQKGIWAAVISGIYFGIWHGRPIQILYTAIMGVALGFIYFATESLWFVIFIHVINNFVSALPPFLDYEEVYGAITIVSYICIIPMVVWLVQMVRKKQLATVSETKMEVETVS